MPGTNRSSASRNAKYGITPLLVHGLDPERYGIWSLVWSAYRPFELVVLDDRSTNGSGDFARRYGSAVRFTRHERKGLGTAQNAAVELARGSA